VTRKKPTRPRNQRKPDPPTTTAPPTEITTTTTQNTNAAPGERLYRAAVAEVKEILARQDSDWRRIGERVAEVEKAYGENRFGQLAKDVGLAACTLRRYCQVAKRAKEIEEKCALGRVLNYSAVRE
jgi:hypothetical protein